MTEADVRAVFFKNYSGCDLNEALVAAVEEITLIIIRESVEKPESLPEIVGTIAMGKSHVVLFMRMTDGTNPIVPVSYLVYFDELRKAMVDIIRHTHDNLEAMDPWFRERFKEEQLSSMLAEMTFSIEKATERPANIRLFHSSELALYEEFFNSALVGIIGPDNFLKYAQEYNRCIGTLRQCQVELRVMGSKVLKKES